MAGFSLTAGGVAVIARLEDRGRAAGHQIATVIAVIAFAAVGKPVEHQKIKHLVLPGDRGGGELALAKLRKV